MAEYIEREALLGSIGLTRLHFVAHGDNKSLYDIINEQPAADVATVVHGRWVNSHDNPVAFSKRDSRCPSESCYCSECHEWLTASDEYDCLGNYCPNCGAKMDLED